MDGNSFINSLVHHFTDSDTEAQSDSNDLGARFLALSLQAAPGQAGHLRQLSGRARREGKPPALGPHLSPLTLIPVGAAPPREKLNIHLLQELPPRTHATLCSLGHKVPGWAMLAPREIHGWLLGSAVCPGEATLPGLPGVPEAGQAVHVFLLDVLVTRLEGREEEVIPAAYVDGVHHVTDQVDLGPQVLDSGT